MPSCAVATCTNNQRNVKNKNIHFHHFPKNEHLCRIWNVKCKRLDAIRSNNAVICSSHFLVDDYIEDKMNKLLGRKERVILKPGAVPSQNLPKKLEVTKCQLSRQQRYFGRNIGNINPVPSWEVAQLDGLGEVGNGQNANHNVASTSQSRNQSTGSKEITQVDGYSLVLTNLQTDLRLTKLKNKQLQNKIRILKSQPITSNILSQNQTKHHSKNRKVRWTSQEIAKALSLLSTSGNAYNLLRNNWKLCLPSPRTLRKWKESFNCFPGVLNEVLVLLKEEGSQLQSHEKYCVLNFDEMKTSSRIVIDTGLDKVMGPSSNAQVIICNGIFSKWKQPIFYDFDKPMTKQILMDVILKLSEIGFIVLAIVSDLGGSNQGLWSSLEITEQKTFFEVNHNHKVWVFADAPHMMKLIRNHLLDTGWVLPDGTVVDKHTLEMLLLFDSYEIKLCPKLSQSLIEVKGVERMKVNKATQLLSHHTATLCKFVFPDNLHIAEFFQTMDDYFDIFNSRVQFDNTKPLRSAFGALHYEDQEKKLKVVEEIIGGMRALFWSKKENKLIPRKALLPCQKGILSSIKSLRGLLYDIKQLGLSYIITRRLNQDPLESLFSIIRSMGRTNDHPDCSQFRHRMKAILTGSRFNLPAGFNVENDDSQYFVSSRLLELVKSNCQNRCREFEAIPLSVTKTVISTSNSISKEASLNYIAGYLAFVLKRKYKLIFGSRTSDTENTTTCFNACTKELSFGKLMYPTPELKLWVENCEAIFCTYFSKDVLLNNNNISKNIQHKITTLHPEINVRVVKEFVKIRLKIKLKALNSSMQKSRQYKRTGT